MDKIDLLILCHLLITFVTMLMGVLYLRWYLRWPALFQRQIRFGVFVIAASFILGGVGTLIFVLR